MLIFSQYLLTFGQHSLTWNCIHATKVTSITYLIYSEIKFICVAWIQFQANECWPKVNKCWHKINICCKLTKRIYSWLLGHIQMFFKCKTFVNIAEMLFTATFSKENIGKNGQKNEKCQNFRIFFVNSQDMMTWVSLDENMFPRSVLNTLSYSQTYYP